MGFDGSNSYVLILSNKVRNKTKYRLFNVSNFIFFRI